MFIQQEFHDEVAVLTVSKSLTTGKDVAPFQDLISNLVIQGTRKVVVDLSMVNWFGTAMLGVFSGSIQVLRKAGGDLRLAEPSKKMDRIFKMTGLADFIKTLDTVDEAVASFGKPGQEKEISS